MFMLHAPLTAGVLQLVVDQHLGVHDADNSNALLVVDNVRRRELAEERGVCAQGTEG